MRDTCDDIVSLQAIKIPRLRMVGDGTMLHPHTLTQESSGRCFCFGAAMISASVLLSFSDKLIGSLSIPRSTQVYRVGRHLHNDGIEGIHNAHPMLLHWSIKRIQYYTIDTTKRIGLWSWPLCQTTCATPRKKSRSSICIRRRCFIKDQVIFFIELLIWQGCRCCQRRCIVRCMQYTVSPYMTIVDFWTVTMAVYIVFNWITVILLDKCRLYRRIAFPDGQSHVSKYIRARRFLYAVIGRESVSSTWHYLAYYRGQRLRDRASDSRLRGPGFEFCAAVLKPWVGKFFHSTLLQFTKLYKRVPGYRQWWICVRAAFVH